MMKKRKSEKAKKGAASFRHGLPSRRWIPGQMIFLFPNGVAS
jgi:hypothetical protein